MTTPVAVAVAIALWAGCLWSAPVWTIGVALVVLGAAYVATAAVACHLPDGTAPRAGRVTAEAPCHPSCDPTPRPSADRVATTAVVLLVVAAALLGGGLAGGRDALREWSPLVDLAARGSVADVTARVVTEPHATAAGAWVIARVTRVDDVALAGRAVLRVASVDALDVGQTITGRMRVARLPDGGFGAHLRTLGVSAALRPTGPIATGPAPPVLARTTAIRLRARTVFARALPADRAALLGGLVLGARDGIDEDVLRAAGLTHLVVVSGRHVGVLLAGVLAIAAACGLGHRGRHRLALAALWWFVVLTRWQPSVLRAAVMATLALAAALAGRGRRPVHALAVTVVVLLLCDPLLARRAGFAMSVLATGGVLVALRRPPDRGGRLWTVARATLAAQLATAPVALAIADALPLGAVPANLIAAPAATVAQAIGLLVAAMAAATVPGAAQVARLAGPPLALLQWAARTFASWPSLTAWHAWGAGASMVVVAAVRLRRPASWPRHGRALVVAVVAVWACVTVASLVRPADAPAYLRLVALDVGQGDALLVEAPHGSRPARMLVDGGPDPDAVDAALRHRRIRRLDAVVVSHGDHDHTGGLQRVLQRTDVGRVIIPAGDPTLRDSSPSAQEALDAARRSDVPIVEAARGQRFMLGRATVDVLAPAAHRLPGADRNTRSIVLRVAGAHGSMLLTGDADELAQLRLLGQPAEVRADVLKVPHHGGATNAHGFLDAVRARVAVVSVGDGNRYGHPHPDTVSDIAPVPVWRTDRHGTVTVTLTPAGPVVEHTDGAGT